MGFFERLSGAVANFLQLGGPDGAALKNVSGTAIEARNASDASYVIVRGATPVAANDLTTKAYVDGLAAGGVQAIRFPIALVSTASTTQIPANAIVLRASLDIATPYTNGTTISVGKTGGSGSELMATTDSFPSSAAPNMYQAPQDTDWGAGAATVSVTVTGGPAAGDGFCLVEYVTPQA